ncbi:uncharacterized protein LOC132554469 [Ylistrum balloti]|uniref:uncharacterized protein LOC132554469 n=1 Tax=Ylistrum balloti TaxID=509963 RepID=UPI002905DD30|nr:uncharacterized protein LOC132554469 [Ylistrum balloti]
MADDVAISVCTMKPAVGEAGQKAGSNELELEKLNLTEGSAISENMVMIKGKKQQLIFQHTGPVIIGDHTKVIVNNVGCSGKGEDIRQEQHVKETLTKDDARDKLKKKRRNHDYQGSCSGQQNEKTKDLPDRVPTPKEIGRVSKYIGFSYQLFFVELNCPCIVIEQEMEEYRHLSFRSRITKIFLRLLKTEEDITFIDVANAMQKHGMDPSSLHNIIDCNSDVIFRDERLADSVLHNAVSLQDIPIVAEYLEVKSYVNFFLEVGFLPKTIDEFDDKFKTKKTYMKINAMLNTFLNETNPRPTLNTILLAIETCEMDTISLISALNLI